MLHIRIELLVRHIWATSEHRLQCLCAILAASIMLAAPLSANAGEVLGQVTLQEDRTPAANRTLEFRRVDGADEGIPVTISTNENGEYRIFLEPGEYVAKLQGNNRTQTVRSFAVRIQEDLKL